MIFYLLQKKQLFVEFLRKQSDTVHARVWLFVISFTDSFISPFPPDPFLVTVIIAGQQKRWFQLTTLILVASVLGGIVGYVIGLWFFDVFGQTIVSLYGQTIADVGEKFAENAFLTILLAAITPVPYMVFAVGAGVFSINFTVFLLATVVGRSFRFFIVGYLSQAYGLQAVRLVFRYFNITFFFLFLLAILYYLLQTLL